MAWIQLTVMQYFNDPGLG